MSLVLNLAFSCCLVLQTSMVLVFGPFPMAFHLSRPLFDTKSLDVKHIILGLILPFPKSPNNDNFVTMYILPSRGWTFLQIFEVAPSLYMVELRKSRGDTLEFHKVRMFICFHFWLYLTKFWAVFPPHKILHVICLLNCFDVHSSTRISPLGWKTLSGRLGKRSKKRMLQKVRFSFQVIYFHNPFFNFGV